MKKLLQATFLLCIFGTFSQTLLAQAGGTKPELNMYRYNSTAGAGNPQPVVMGDTLGTLQYKGLTGPGKVMVGASIRSFATGPVSPGFLPSNLVFRTGAPTQKNRMVITAEGLVGIGTMMPEYHLHTVGNTHTSGNFYGRIHFDKNMTTNDAPNTYFDEAYFELKNRAVLAGGLALPASAGNQGGVITLGPGGTSSDHQLFFGSDGIWNRYTNGSAADWTGANWSKLLSSTDINGTPNRIARFLPPDNPSSKLGDSQLFDDGARVGIRNFAPGTDVDITGATRVGGNLGLGTLPTANRLEVAGNSRLDGTATLTGNLGIGKAATAFDLDVAGESNFDGRVKIGTTDFPSSTDFELAVGGGIIAEEVLVQLQGAWPDYVFDENYTAPDLCAWEDFILKNKHLPGMPSASEVAAKGGVDLGETQRLLLEKIEQLTLIIIEQQKQIDALKK